MASLVERVTIINRCFITDNRGWFLKAITGTEKVFLPILVKFI